MTKEYTPIFTKLYLIFAITPIHAGSGRGAEEYVDLPIQRDALNLPTIWGSSIKGALRTAFRVAKGSDEATEEEKVIFGPEREQAHEYASSLSILDAKLFLFPVPSLRGAYAFVTTPIILERVKEIFQISGKEELVNNISLVVNLAMEKGKTLLTSDKLILSGRIWLRNYPFDAEISEEVRALFDKIFSGINIPISKQAILNNIAIIPDDIGIQFISRSTIPVTRIALDYRKKVVKEGALWTEEYVPELTMFVTVFLFSKPKMKMPGMETPQDLFSKFGEVIGATTEGDFNLVLGGHETIGKGIVKFCGWK